MKYEISTLYRLTNLNEVIAEYSVYDDIEYYKLLAKKYKYIEQLGKLF